MSTLTRQEMAAVLQDKGTVVYKGRLIRSVQDLPSEAELSIGKPEEEKIAEKNIQAEMARLKDELSKLKASASGDTEEKKPTPISRKAGETKISAADASA